MNTPEVGDSITLTTTNRDQVILFVHSCSEWVAAFKPSTDDEPPIIIPGDDTVIVEALYAEARVRVGDTVARTGEEQLTILDAHGGEAMLDLERSEPALGKPAVMATPWVRAYHLRTLAELTAAGLKVEGRADVTGEFPHPAVPRIEFHVRGGVATAVQRLYWDARDGWGWTDVKDLPHNDSSAWHDFDLPVDVDARTFAAAALQVCREHPEVTG